MQDIWSTAPHAPQTNGSRTGATSGTITPYHSGTHEFISSVFSWVRGAQSLVFSIVFCRSLFFLFSFGHCVVCPSFMSGLWLPFRYLQTILKIHPLYTFIEYKTLYKNLYSMLILPIMKGLNTNHYNTSISNKQCYCLLDQVQALYWIRFYKSCNIIHGNAI